jgi:hypothetical protein
MKKIIPILFILFVFAAGCVQTSDTAQQYSKYSYPDTGFAMKYPESWTVTQTANQYDPTRTEVRFTAPGNRTSFSMLIDPWHLVQGKTEGGVGIGYDVPYPITTIEFQKEIQISGEDAIRWTFLVNAPDRDYIDVIIHISQKCPGKQNNRVYYWIGYDYTANDTETKDMFDTMLGSIELTCPSDSVDSILLRSRTQYNQLYIYL